MGTFDEPRNISHDETLAVVVTDHAQIRGQRSKRIVGDFRPHRGDRRDQRRLAGVGQPDDADIGEQAQLDLKLSLFSRFSRLSEARALEGRCREVRVALSASAAGGDNHCFPRRLKIGDQLTRHGVADYSTHGHLDFTVVAPPPMTVAPHAMLAAASFVLFLIAQIEERRQLRVGDDDNVTAMATVATARPAAWDKLLSAKGHATTPAGACDHSDLYFIDELHGSNGYQWPAPS